MRVNSIRAEAKGVALVQILVMAAVLSILVVGLLNTILTDHIIAWRVVESTKARFWTQACLGYKSAQWKGSPCGGAAADSCDFTPWNGPVVAVTCSGAGAKQVSFKASY